jgi:GNAT superfamily N-acetyltransferase
MAPVVNRRGGKMKTSAQHAEKWRGVPPSNGPKTRERVKKLGPHSVRRMFANLNAAACHPIGESNVEKYRIETSEYAVDKIEALIAEGLNQYNDEVTGSSDRRPLAVTVKDPISGEVLGGITGRSSLGLLFVDLFYLPESMRGAGLGSELLRRFELEGRRRGCVSAVLYTISFQAPRFYELNGWMRFGEVPCLPAGTSRIFMSKTL